MTDLAQELYRPAVFDAEVALGWRVWRNNRTEPRRLLQKLRQDDGSGARIVPARGVCCRNCVRMTDLAQELYRPAVFDAETASG